MLSSIRWAFVGLTLHPGWCRKAKLTGPPIQVLSTLDAAWLQWMDRYWCIQHDDEVWPQYIRYSVVITLILILFFSGKHWAVPPSLINLSTLKHNIESLILLVNKQLIKIIRTRYNYITILQVLFKRNIIYGQEKFTDPSSLTPGGWTFRTS